MFKYTHPHWYTKKFSLNESRLISFASDAPGAKPEHKAEAEKSDEKPDEERDKAKDVEEVQSGLDARIGNATASIENFPEEFKKQMKNNVAQFCEVSYDDMASADGNESMSKGEHAKWKTAAMKQIDAVLSGIEGEGEGAKSGEEESEEALKTIEGEMADLEGELGVLDHAELDLNPEKLKDPTTLPEELQKYEERAGAINEQRNALAGKMKEVTQVKGAFDKQVEANNVIAGVTGGAVLVGAVGVAVATSWVPGLNLVTGAVALAAAAVAAATKAALIASERAMAKKANASITEFKGKYNKKRTELAGVVKDMNEDGTQIHAAAPSLRAEIEETRDTNLEAGTVSLGDNEANREQVTAELARAEAQLSLINEHKDVIAQQKIDLENSRFDAASRGEEVDASKHDLGAKLGSVESAIAQIEESGALEGGNEEAKAKYEELLGYKEKMKGGVALLGTGGDKLKEFMVGTEYVSEKFDEQYSLLAYSEAALTSTSTSLELAGLSLDTNITEMKEALGAIDAGAAAEIKTVNEVQAKVSSGVSTIAIENIKAQTAVEMQFASMQDVKIETPSFASALAIGAAAPFELIFKTVIGDNLNKLGKGMGPVLGAPFRFLGGVSEAAGDITGGMAKMVVLLPAALGGNEEGMHMAGAMGSLLLVGTTEGSREAWTGMGKAIVAADEWGNDGAKAAGKAAANIAMFFIPGAGAGVGAGRAAFAATRVAGGGVRNAALATAKGVGVGLKTTVVESGKAYGSMARGAAKKIRGIPGALRKAPGALKRGVKGLKARVTGRGKGAAEGVATEGAAAETAAEATAATTESTAARGSVLDDLGNAVDDAGNVIDDASRTPQNLAEGTRGTMKSARQVRDGMHPDKFGEVSKNGILKDQPSVMKEFLEGKSSRITIKEMNAEIARCKQYMHDLPASDKMGQLGAHETMVNGLKQLRAQTRAIKAARTKLTDRLGFKKGQRVKLKNKKGETWSCEYAVDPSTGKIRLEGFKPNAPMGTKMTRYISPERLRNFKQAAGKPSTAPAAKPAPAPASTPATASAPAGTPASAPAAAAETAASTASGPWFPRTRVQVRAMWIQAKRLGLRIRRPRKATAASAAEAAPAPVSSVSTPAPAPVAPTGPTTAYRAGKYVGDIWRNRPRYVKRAMDAWKSRRAESAASRARHAERLEAGRGARASNRVSMKEARANRTVAPEVLEGLPGSAMEATAPIIDTTAEAAMAGRASRTLWQKYGPASWRTRLKVGSRRRATARTERVAANKRTTTKRTNRKATRRRVAAENKATARTERTATRTRKAAVKERAGSIKRARDVNATEIFINEEGGMIRLDALDDVIKTAGTDKARACLTEIDDILHGMVNEPRSALMDRVRSLRDSAAARVDASVFEAAGTRVGGKVYLKGKGQPLEVMGVNDKGLLVLKKPKGQLTSAKPSSVRQKPVDTLQAEARAAAKVEAANAEAAAKLSTKPAQGADLVFNESQIQGLSNEALTAQTKTLATGKAPIEVGPKRLWDQAKTRTANEMAKRGIASEIEAVAAEAAMPNRLAKDFRTWTDKQLQTAFQERRIAQSQGAGTQAEQMYMGRDIGDIIGQLKVRGVAPLEPGMAEIAVLPPRLKGGSYRNWSDARLQEAFQQRRIAQSQGIGTKVEQMYMGSDLDTIISQLNARKVAPIEPPATGGFSNAA